MSQPSGAPFETASYEFDALRYAGHYRRALAGEFQTHLRGRVLEVGAGIGQFTEELAQCPGITELLAVEPDAVLARQFALRWPDRNIVCGTIEAVGPETSWNAIVCVNVLEHIEKDEAELAQYQARLRQAGGALCLFVPARMEIYAPLDRDFGHYRRYHLGELRRKLEAAGFTISKLCYYNWLGYFAWWFSFCLLKQRHFSPGAVRLYDRLVFPIVHWSEANLVRPPFGQSLLAIARAQDR